MVLTVGASPNTAIDGYVRSGHATPLVGGVLQVLVPEVPVRIRNAELATNDAVRTILATPIIHEAPPAFLPAIAKR